MIATPLILIVDDDPELGGRLTRAVQRAAGTFAAELLLDYAAAIERLQQMPIPHVVVMEYRLHTRTGVELAQWMAVQAHLVATHRVLYTATPPALIVWDPVLIAQEAPAADERACVLFALVIAKGAGGSAAQLAGMAIPMMMTAQCSSRAAVPLRAMQGGTDMSSYRTHALIGAVGGLGLARALDMLPQGAALGQTIFGQIGVQGVVVPPGAAAVLSTAGLVLGSAFLALVSDIDEPGSWVARRAKTVIALACAPLFGAVGFALASNGTGRLQPIIAAVLGALVGMSFIGPLLGHLIVRLIRTGAGGHRRLTHSLLLGGALALVAVGLWFAGLRAWAIIPAALTWGILLHDLGDVGTPAGLPLFYPMSNFTIHALPRVLRPYGEPIAAMIALIVGFALWPR